MSHSIATPHAPREFSLRPKPSTLEPPTPFCRQTAEWLEEWITRHQRWPDLLDLGAGLCRDAKYFASCGLSVTALDWDAESLSRGSCSGSAIQTLVTDLRKPLALVNDAFDIVYSHLLLHCNFTSDEITVCIDEVVRVLRSGGEFYLSVRSTSDPTYHTLGQPGAGYRQFGGTGLHFFSKKLLRHYLQRFNVAFLEEQSEILSGEKYGVIYARAVGLK